MRLARPKFSEAAPFAVDPLDAAGFSQLLESALNKNDSDKKQDVIGDYFIAPQMFENIYLGETFTFYVNCTNESDQKVTDVTVKCDLQTNSQRVSLNSNIHEVVLEGGKCSGQIISHEVKEIGQHILICSVNYKTSSDEKMYFRKFIKFPVSKPIDVKTKFYNAENNDVYLEAQIENTAATAMILERVELEPSPNYTVTSIHCGYKDMTNIGKLDMSWRTSMGERGRLQTSPLQRITSRLLVGFERIQSAWVAFDRRNARGDSPPTAMGLIPFTLELKRNNCCFSERSLDLQLELQNTSTSLVFCSISGVSLGQVPPNGSVTFSVEMLPISIGFQSISGIRIVDSFLKKTYDHDDIAQVFVM
ncbi:hypothetical protein OSTOST_06840 [Ostertagia ostertagi]